MANISCVPFHFETRFTESGTYMHKIEFVYSIDEPKRSVTTVLQQLLA